MTTNTRKPMFPEILPDQEPIWLTIGKYPCAALLVFGFLMLLVQTLD